MQKGNNRDGSKRAGLSVRYCFDGTDGDCRPGTEDADNTSEPDEQTVCHVESTAPAKAVPRKPPHHLPRPNYWFDDPSLGLAFDTRRRTRQASARLRRHGYSAPQEEGCGDGREWRGEGEEDPGFFVTAKVKQPPLEDTLSWDSSCSSSSSDEDLRDVLSARSCAGRRSSNNNYLWGSSHPPVPPSNRNVTANKATEETVTRASMVGGHSHKKVVENTYRLEPKHGQAFVWFKVKKPIVNIVDNLLDEFAYNAKSGPTVTRKLCEVIMKMVKKTFDWPRYRFVCHVVLAQLKHQGIMIADRSLWSTSVDNVASYTYKNKALVCVVTFHAIYFE